MTEQEIFDLGLKHADLFRGKKYSCLGECLRAAIREAVGIEPVQPEPATSPLYNMGNRVMLSQPAAPPIHGLGALFDTLNAIKAQKQAEYDTISKTHVITVDSYGDVTFKSILDGGAIVAEVIFMPFSLDVMWSHVRPMALFRHKQYERAARHWLRGFYYLGSIDRIEWTDEAIAKNGGKPPTLDISVDFENLSQSEGV